MLAVVVVMTNMIATEDGWKRELVYVLSFGIYKEMTHDLVCR